MLKSLVAGAAGVVAGGVALAQLLGVELPTPWPLPVLGAALLALIAAFLPGRRGDFDAPSRRNGGNRIDPIESEQLRALRSEIDSYKKLERELTEAKQTAEAATMSKGEFLATMSHEIRTPLNGIIPLLDILLSTRLEVDQREYLTTALQSAQQLLRIVDDILDYSKLEANKLALENVGVNLKELLDGVQRLMERSAEGKGLRFSVRIDPAVRLAVRSDPVRLRQILTNLISNAIKFTERGQVMVQVTRRGETRSHHDLRFEVRDTGVGIAPDAAEKLFKPFSQADASTTRTFGGTGLGLVICKRIVDLMGGQMGVESAPGRGSNFWFQVPMLKALGDIGARRRELNGSRILLVTSDQHLHRRMALAAPNWGITLVHAAATQEALTKLRAAAARSGGWAFHLLLVDMGSVRNTALGLHRSVLRESELDEMLIVYLETDDPMPQELVTADRTLVVPRHAPEPELRRQIARLMEGEIVPATPHTATPNVQLDEAASGSAPAAKPAPLKGHVLLVEDNPVNRQVAQRLLSLAGLTIDCADDGREAVQRLADSSYDAVLMDCQMPVMDGYAATRERRRIEAEQRLPRMPIIAMTANAMVGDREKCLDAGMDDYLSKPLNRAVLEECLGRWLPKPAARAAPAPAAPNSPPRDPTPRAGDNLAPRAAAPAPARPAPRPAAPEKPALKDDIVDDLRDIMGSEFLSLVRVFLEDAPRAIARLQEAAAADDIPALVPPAHSLKSTSANLGAIGLSELARDIEQGARMQTLTQPVQLTDALAREFARVDTALRAFLGR